MGIRDEQREKRRFEILQAALDLFISKGYAATKVSDIASKVGMSVGLMFHYFESKEKLYEELIKIGISGPMGVMAQGGAEPLEFFERSAAWIFEAIKKSPFTAKMFVLMGQAAHQATVQDAAPQSVQEALAGFNVYPQTVSVIEQGQRDGTIREGEPLALAIAFWCAIQGIAEQLAVIPEFPCPRGEWIVDILRRKPE